VIRCRRPSRISQKLPYRQGQLKLSDIKKAVNAVVNERVAAERAAKAAK
jgi:hypothetical protein